MRSAAWRDQTGPSERLTVRDVARVKVKFLTTGSETPSPDPAKADV